MENINNSVMSVKDWLITVLLSFIPLVGIFMMFYWAFGSNVNANKSNWAKAMILLAVIMFVVVGLMLRFIPDSMNIMSVYEYSGLE